MTNKHITNAAKRLNNIKIYIDTDIMHLDVKECRYAIADNANFRRSAHRHAFFELHYVTNEYMTCTVNNIGYTVKKGEFILIPPQTEHQIDFQCSNFKKLVMGFDISTNPNHIDSQFYRKALSYVYSIDKFCVYKETDFMVVLLHKLLSECHENSMNIYSKLCSAIQMLICEILSSVAKTQIPTVYGNNHNDVNSTFWAEKVNLYVKDNIEKSLSSKEIADEFHISVQQLNRNLLKESQKTVAQIISDVRFEKIKQLLIETDLSLSCIAESVGISSEYNMNRFFKEQCGMTPGKYRKIFKRS